jgi:hypothetical protein
MQKRAVEAEEEREEGAQVFELKISEEYEPSDSHKA